MGGPEYRFLTRWRIFGTTGEVSKVLENPGDLSRWWPAFCLAAEELSPGDERGVGRRVRLRTKGWLPYGLDWELRVTESRHPFGFSLEARGDLEGTGVWTFEPAGAWTLATCDWRVRAERPLWRALSPLLRPAFEADHRWAMRTGERSLALEIERRRAKTPAERARMPAPPAPASSLPWAVAGALGVVAAFGLGRALSRRRRKRRFRRR